MVGVLIRVVAAAVAAAILAGCTTSPAAPKGTAPNPTGTSAPPSRSTAAPGPVPTSAPPTTAVRAAACPLVGTAFVRNTMGMRLGRLTVLRSGGRTVGCRFYALQGSALHNSEHLPGPRQPIVAVTTRPYASAAAAHNAFVRAARAGRNPAQVPLGRGRVAVCYRTPFYPRDRGQDWACGISVGPLRVLVQTVDTTGTFGPAAVMKAVLAGV